MKMERIRPELAESIFISYYASPMTRQEVTNAYHVGRTTVNAIVDARGRYSFLEGKCQWCAKREASCVTHVGGKLCFACMILYGGLFARHGRLAVEPQWETVHISEHPTPTTAVLEAVANGQEHFVVLRVGRVILCSCI